MARHRCLAGNAAGSRGLTALALLSMARCAASPARPPAEPPAPSATAAPPATERLDIAYTSVGLPQAFLWLAQEVGYYGEEGLAVELHYIPGTSTGVQALLGRDVQVMSGVGSSSISAALGGADTVILANTSDRFTNILMGQPDLEPTADSIRGHTVAVTRFGASSDFVARYWLRRLGLEPGVDVPFIQVGGNPEMAAALISGNAQIASSADLFALELRQQGYRELGAINEPGVDTINNGLITTSSLVAESEALVQRFLRAALRGLARFVQDKDLAVQVVTRYSVISSPVVLEQAWEAHSTKYIKRIPYITPTAVQMALDERAVSDERARTAKPELFYENRFVGELDQAGFFAALYSR